YRYLFHLTRQPDMAEDLTQETFLQGWRRLETFQGRGSLRCWLYRIAHREFLQLLQRRQADPGLDTIAELAAPDAAARLERVELAPMRQWGWLPLDQMHALEMRLGIGGVRCSVFGARSSELSIPNTERRTPNTGSDVTKEKAMERREFLRQAAVGAAGLMLTE